MTKGLVFFVVITYLATLANLVMIFEIWMKLKGVL